MNGNALNAEKLGGYAATNYPCHLGVITDVELLNNPAYQQSYEGLADGQKLGIPGINREWWGCIRYTRNAYPDGHGMQEFRTFENVLWRRSSIKLDWSPWVKTATATPPAVYDLPLAAGVTNNGLRYFKTQDNVVTVLGSAKASFDASVYKLVGTLPVGFRISNTAEFSVSFSGGIGRGSVDTSGSIRVVSSESGERYVYINFSFVAS